MVDVKSTLTETLRAHRLVQYVDQHPPHCVCGWTSPEQDCTRTDHPEHVAGVLLGLSGVAVTALPEPDDDHGDGIAFWTDQAVGVADGMVVTRFDPGSEAIYLEPSVARKLAAALLAAAVVSEGETHPEAAK